MKGMTESQRRTLQCLLDATKKLPPQERLEAILVSARTHLSLYQQENDEEGVAIYSPLVDLIQSSQSVSELLERAKNEQRD
jgi:hypothetical protein